MSVETIEATFSVGDRVRVTDTGGDIIAYGKGMTRGDLGTVTEVDFDFLTVDLDRGISTTMMPSRFEAVDAEPTLSPESFQVGDKVLVDNEAGRYLTGESRTMQGVVADQCRMLGGTCFVVEFNERRAHVNIEHLTKIEDAHVEFQVGDKVRVAADAGVKAGEPGGVFFGGEVVGTVTEAPTQNGTVVVRANTVSGGEANQVVHVSWLTKVEGTDEPEEPVTFKPGDKVRVSADPKCNVWSEQDEPDGYVSSEFAGEVVEVVSDLLGDGNYRVKREGRFGPETNVIAPQHLTKIEDEEKAPEPEVPTHQSFDADQYVIVREGRQWASYQREGEIPTYEVSAFQTGALGRVKRNHRPGYDCNNVQVELIYPNPHYEGYWDYIADVELTKITPEEAEEYKAKFEVKRAEKRAEEAEARAEAAEKALAEYKVFVRTKVIEESEKQDWCSRTDSWLEELGLPTRWGSLPKGVGTVLLLNDGRLAVGDQRGVGINGAFHVGTPEEIKVGRYNAGEVMPAWQVEPLVAKVLSEGDPSRAIG